MTDPAAAVDLDMLTMYSTTWCGYCRRLKLQLDQAGLNYREVDIERDADAARFVEGVNGGNQTVPVIEFPDGKTATNPSLAQVQAGLAA
jgi:mycoredoxin